MLVQIIMIVLMAGMATSGACPLWTYSSSSGQCQCGDSLNGVVHCDNKTLKVSLLFCYCMTYNEHLSQTLVGQCLVMWKTYYHLSNSEHIYNDVTSDRHNKTCQHFKRTGQLCGKCMEGYGPPVYSYSLKCVECSESHFKHNLLRYIAIAFGPLTLFYLVVVVFRISVTSGSMTAYVLAIQLSAISVIIKGMLRYNDHEASSKPIKALATVIAIWNLDMFRSLYTPFCINPKMTPLQVLALDYLVGVYPLFLILLTYIAVSLHDRYSLVVNMWRPAYKCLSYFRREWDIHGSLVQAFATFLVLSYVKILDVSFDLLTPVYLRRINGKYLEQPYLYNDGEVMYFGREHLPYGVLAIIMLTVFNILPVILLLVYPCSCFQKCLNCWRLHSHTLHTFMDVFQGCYHHHPRDCRYFASFYLFVRILQLLIFALLKDYLYVIFIAFIFLILTVINAIFTPYKDKIHNKVSVFIFFLVASLCLISTADIYRITTSFISFKKVIHYAYILTGAVFFLYPTIICLSSIIPRKYLAKVASSLMKRVPISTRVKDIVENSFPHRLHHMDENSPLLQVPHY